MNNILCKDHNFISAIVYIQNDSKYIMYFLKNLYKILYENFIHFEIICVNDCSDDNSNDLIREFSKSMTNGNITIIEMSVYQGIDSSINAGVDLSIGDFVIEFDDIYMDYDPNIIMQVYKKCLSGFDITFASPKNFIKKSSKLFYSVFNKFSKNNHEIRTNTFTVLSRRAINRITSINKAITYRKAVYSSSGLKTDSIIYENKTKKSTNIDKNSKFHRKNTAVDSLILFTDIAYKFSFYFSLSMMICTVLMLLYTFAIFLFKNNTPEGWSTIIIFLSTAFFGIFFILSIIIKYLSIMIKLLFKNSKYIVSSIEKIK